MKLMEQVRQILTEMEYAGDTRRVYARWIVRFIHFSQMQHPATLGAMDIERFMGYLAVKQQLSAASCNQALNALQFLYQCVLDRPDVAAQVNRLHARRPILLPQTASRREIDKVLAALEPKYQLMVYLCYGAGLSIGECVRLKLTDIDQSNLVIIVNGRTTMIPERSLTLLRQQTALASVWPGNIDKYLFPSGRMHHHRCWFVSESSLQKAMKKVTDSQARRITPKVLRHSFVRHLLKSGYDVRTVQEVAGYANVKSVLVYQRMNNLENVVSPLDNIGKR